MKVSVSQKLLASALLESAQALDNANVTYKFLMLEAKDSSLWLRSTNLTVDLELAVAASIAMEGKALIEGGQFVEFVLGLSDEDVLITASRTNFKAVCGKTECTFRVANPDLYPFPAFPQAQGFTQEGPELAKAISKVLGFATESDDWKAGIHIDGSGYIAACDSQRVARYEIAPMGNLQATIHYKPAGLLQQLAARSNAITLGVAQNKFLMFTDGVRFSTQLLASQFPSATIGPMFLVPTLTEVQVDVKEFSKALRATARLAKKSLTSGTMACELLLRDGVLTLVHKSDIGERTQVLEKCTYSGEDVDVSFHSEFPNDALSNMTGIISMIIAKNKMGSLTLRFSEPKYEVVCSTYTKK